jgi:hypothetical protein
MSLERMKVLEMLANGKITAEEADRLLTKLATAKRTGDRDGATADEFGPGEGEQEAQPRARKFLRIEAGGPDTEKVNVRVPLGFLRAGLKLGTILPVGVREKLADRGIDAGFIAASNAEELARALDDLDVDIDEGRGGRVRIYCE